MSGLPTYQELPPEINCITVHPMASDSTCAAWRIPLYTILLAGAVLLPLDVGWPDISFLVNFFFVGPMLLLATVVFLIYVAVQSVRSRLKRTLTLSLLAGLIGVWGVGILLEVNGQRIRDDGRWLIYSREYKALVLSQPNPPNGHLKYIAWDSWGMFAQDSDEFLVYDPADSLAKLNAPDPGITNGVDVGQFVARRLENHWYLVTYPF